MNQMMEMMIMNESDACEICAKFQSLSKKEQSQFFYYAFGVLEAFVTHRYISECDERKILNGFFIQIESMRYEQSAKKFDWRKFI